MCLEKLSNIFKMININGENEEIHYKFNCYLKNCLKQYFGEQIFFDNNESYYIDFCYKNVFIRINTYNGIALIIDDETKIEIVKDFEPIFKYISGYNMICSYQLNENYFVFEWNSNPDYRLNDLMNSYIYISNFKDYYNISIIKQLDTELLSLNGYIQLFSNCNNQDIYISHKMKLIENIHPDIKSYMLFSWIEYSRLKLSFAKIR